MRIAIRMAPMPFSAWPGSTSRLATICSTRSMRAYNNTEKWSSLLLPDREVNPFQHSPCRVANFDVPRSLRVGRDRLAAPRPPWRSADRERYVTHLVAAVKPDVMQRLAIGPGHAHPQHDRADAVGEGRAGILRRAVDERPCQDRLDVYVAGRRWRRCGRRCRTSGRILRRERTHEAQHQHRREERFHVVTPWLKCARSAARRLRRSSDAPSTAAMRQPNSVPPI